MGLSVRTRLPLFIEAGKTQTLSLYLEQDGSGVTPTTVLLNLYDEGSNLIVTDGNVTEADPSTYSLTSAVVPTTLALSDKWRAKWSVTISGEVHTLWQQAYLCRQVLYPVIGQTDLYARHPELANLLPSTQTSWQTQLTDSFEELQLRLLEDAKRPHLILSPFSLARSHTALCLGRIFAMLATLVSDNGRYQKRSDAYLAEYEAHWGALTFDYDYDESGQITDDEEGISGEPVVYLNMTPKGVW